MKNARHLKARVSRNLPSEYFLLLKPQGQGEVIGHFGNRAIYESVVDANGTRYDFVGVAPRDPEGRLHVDLLGPGEWLIEPDLIYSADEAAPTRPRLSQFLRGLRKYLPTGRLGR